MNHLFLIVLLSPVALFAQRNVPDVSESTLLLRSVQQTGNGYLAEVTVGKNAAWNPFLPAPDSYATGLTRFDEVGNVQWLVVPEKGSLLDYRQDQDTIYCLMAFSSNSMTVSSAYLELVKRDLNGRQLSSQQLLSVSMVVPNAKFDAVFDDSGNIWAWTTWNGLNEIRFNETNESCEPDMHCRFFYVDRYGHVLKKQEVSGSCVRLDAYDASEYGTGFVLRSEKNAYPEQDGLILLLFDRKGKFKHREQIAGPRVYGTKLSIEKEAIYLAGTFSANSLSTDFPATEIGGLSLSSPMELVRKEPALSAFVARLSTDLDLSWCKVFNCGSDVKLNSMSVSDEKIAVSLEYNDQLGIIHHTDKQAPVASTFPLPADADIINACDIDYLKSYDSDYNYSDDVIFLLDENGKTEITYPATGSGSVFVELFGKTMILHGRFFSSFRFMEHQLASESKNNVYFLLFDRLPD